MFPIKFLSFNAFFEISDSGYLLIKEHYIVGFEHTLFLVPCPHVLAAGSASPHYKAPAPVIKDKHYKYDKNFERSKKNTLWAPEK